MFGIVVLFVGLRELDVYIEEVVGVYKPLTSSHSASTHPTSQSGTGNRVLETVDSL